VTTAKKCHGWLEVKADPIILAGSVAFVGDFPQPNPRQETDIDPHEIRLRVAVCLRLAEPRLLQYHGQELGASQPTPAGTYLTTWDFLQNRVVQPLPPGTHFVRVVLHSEAFHWASDWKRVDVTEAPPGGFRQPGRMVST
jgi:hypothetical protein